MPRRFLYTPTRLDSNNDSNAEFGPTSSKLWRCNLLVMKSASMSCVGQYCSRNWLFFELLTYEVVVDVDVLVVLVKLRLLGQRNCTLVILEDS